LAILIKQERGYGASHRKHQEIIAPWLVGDPFPVNKQSFFLFQKDYKDLAKATGPKLGK